VFPFGVEAGYPLPTYNVKGHELGHSDSKQFLTHMFNVTLAIPVRTNFIWEQFDFGGYYRAHRPFAEAFQDKHGVALVSVLGILACLACRALFIWEEEGIGSFFHFWQRSYEGPHTRGYVRDQLGSFAKEGKHLLGATDDEWKAFDVDAGMAYWELSPQAARRIDLVYSGPHCVFLPFGEVVSLFLCRS
jgi:hypothetical protein